MPKTDENRESDLFKYEKGIISKAENALNREENKNNPLSSEFRKLIKSYQRLLRQSQKLIKISDNQQKNLNAANQRLQKLSEERESAYQELNKLYSIVKQDLHFAKRIQQTILPFDVKELAGKKITLHYQPMAEVGGDIFDIELINPDYIRIFLADATGHGVQAALITMIIKAEYESLKRIIRRPDELLRTMNYQFMRNFKALAEFFTCIVLDLDLEKGMLMYSSAGHPHQLYIGGDVESMPATGKPIGILSETQYMITQTDFHPGDKLLLFSDGLFEEFNEREEEFGEERMLKIVESNMNEPVEKIISTILDEMNQFRNGKQINDDITVIGVE